MNYKGEIGVILINHGKEKFVVEKEMRIAQVEIEPVLNIEVFETKVLSDSNRGEKAYGSSGYTF